MRRKDTFNVIFMRVKKPLEISGQYLAREMACPVRHLIFQHIIGEDVFHVFLGYAAAVPSGICKLEELEFRNLEQP
jgi:hypothetical protein